MATRTEVQELLETLLESEEVYYQPSTNIEMTYPAIVFSKSNIQKTTADNVAYLLKPRYEVTVIARTPDHPVIQKLLELPYCSYDRSYKADNLYHDVLTLY